MLAAPALRLSAQEASGSLLDVARATAARPYVPNTTPLPPPFADLTYDAFRGIRPIAGKAAMLPVGPDYAVDLLPPGLDFPDPVTFELVDFGRDDPDRSVFAGIVHLRARGTSTRSRRPRPERGSRVSGCGIR